ncbi:MAG TPA: hypothetical protein ENJ99_05540 [Rhizobiales bacterium]|nr:hypothetical protein [Hyphomicrobiales bacterium]
MSTFIYYLVAAGLEISGCFAFWIWLRLGKTSLWAVAGALCLTGFALVLIRIDAAFAGRAFAAYGGVYIAASLIWLWLIEGTRPDRWKAGRRKSAACGAFPDQTVSPRAIIER